MKFQALLLGLFVSLPLFAQDSGDSAFLAARDGFRAGNRAKLDRAAEQIGKHALAPYVENYQLRMNMEQGDSAAMRDFLARQEGSYVAEKLRADWIRRLGKRGEWSEIVVEYPNLLAPDADATCYYRQALLAGGDKAPLDEAQQLWLTMPEPSDACRPLFEALIRDNRVTVDDLWARARRQFEANRTGPAKVTLAALPASQAVDVKTLDKLLASPMGYLAKQPASWSSSRSGRELTALAIQDDGSLASEGLELFIGQELVLHTDIARDRAQAAKLAVRLLHWLVEGGAVTYTQTLTGPSGETLILTPQDDGRQVLVTGGSR